MVCEESCAEQDVKGHSDVKDSGPGRAPSEAQEEAHLSEGGGTAKKKPLTQ